MHVCQNMEQNKSHLKACCRSDVGLAAWHPSMGYILKKEPGLKGQPDKTGGKVMLAKLEASAEE